MNDKMELVGEIWWWAQCQTVKKIENFPTRFLTLPCQMTRATVSALWFSLTWVVSFLFQPGSAGDDTVRVRPLKNILLPLLLDTGRVS